MRYACRPLKMLLPALLLALFFCQGAVAAEHPNILWITSEDHGPEMGCYGDKLANTPNTKLSSPRPRLNSHSKGRLSNKPISLLN